MMVGLDGLVGMGLVGLVGLDGWFNGAVGGFCGVGLV